MSALSSIGSGIMPKFDGKKSDWVTPNETADPENLPRIAGYNILIRPVAIDETISVKGTSKVLYIPPSTTEDIRMLTNVGQVKAMGPLCYRDPNVKPEEKGYPHGRYLNPWCNVGDYVVWGKHQGVKIMIRGVAYVLLQDELVLFTLDSPDDINPMMNALKNG